MIINETSCEQGGGGVIVRVEINDSSVLLVWKYPGMLATQDSAREGRDDGAKMAAQLRVLPLRGQEIIKQRLRPKQP